MGEMEGILEGIYSDDYLRKKVVPLFMGNPGLGKTAIIEQFAKKKNANLVQFITSQRNPFEISGMAMPDRDTKKMSYWDFDVLLNLKDGDILFFDEIFNGNPTVLNACLTILESRTMISGEKLPNIMIVAAANPQGMVPLTPQIKERFLMYDVKFDANLWQDYMYNKYLMPKKISSGLSNLIRKENFKDVLFNFDTPRSFDKATAMMIQGIKTPYESKIGVVLNNTIENHFEEDVIEGDFILKPNQMTTWLELARIINKKKKKEYENTKK